MSCTWHGRQFVCEHIVQHRACDCLVVNPSLEVRALAGRGHEARRRVLYYVDSAEMPFCPRVNQAIWNNVPVIFRPTGTFATEHTLICRTSRRPTDTWLFVCVPYVLLPDIIFVGVYHSVDGASRHETPDPTALADFHDQKYPPLHPHANMASIRMAGTLNRIKRSGVDGEQGFWTK